MASREAQWQKILCSARLQQAAFVASAAKQQEGVLEAVVLSKSEGRRLGEALLDEQVPSHFHD